MPSTYERLEMVFSRANRICAVIGACILFFTATIIFIEVMSRALFGTSRLWVIEVSEYSLLFITFLGAPYLLEKNMHVMLDILYDHFSRRWRTIARVFNATIGLLVCSILTVVGIGVVLDQIETGVRETTVMAPQSFWITAALPLGMFLMAVQFLFNVLNALRGKGN